MRRPPKPIIFLGPSIPETDQAREVLDADYRPPIKRGDLEGLKAGAIVGMIDGVFHQELSVSPREVHLATKRGVTIFGSSSMGALRAAEVPAVLPVGLVAEWYRDGTIKRDDEVALVFDPESRRALSVPMVNVRYAVQRLVGSGSLSQTAGERILEATRELPYPDRNYRTILTRAGVDDKNRLLELIGALQNFDIKREDAFALLEEMRRADLVGLAREATTKKRAGPNRKESGVHLDRIRVASAYAATNPVKIWETGALVEFRELIRFLKLTGRYDESARAALTRRTLAGRRKVEAKAVPSAHAIQAFFDRGSLVWGWQSAAEQHVNLDAMGLGLNDLEEQIGEELLVRAAVSRDARRPNQSALARAIRAGMWVEPLRLKVEATRLHAFACLAKASADYRPNDTDLDAAKRKVMRAMNVWNWEEVVERALSLGLTATDPEAFCVELARARHTARSEKRRSVPTELGRDGLTFKSSPKMGSRFTTTPDQVIPVVERLKALTGITRVGFVGELVQLGGIHISQASRPDGTWSSTYGSGKGLTPEAAMIGGVMEETEKWAQEQAAASAQTFYASYRELVDAGRSVVDPARLTLPYDSCYTPELPIAWTSTTNLFTGAHIVAPSEFFYSARRRNTITYSKRLGAAMLGTNGLASGFSLEEALLHAICEFVERHAEHADELRSYPPEGCPPAERFVDLRSLQGHSATVARQLASSGELRLRDITSEVEIPTVQGWYLASNDRLSYSGYGCHPDPEVACEMAMMEAAQSAAVASAGGREDLSLRARSLGRHERTRPRTPEANLHRWLDYDRVEVPVSALGGAKLTDVLDEVFWCLARLGEAGVDTVAAVDMTQPGMMPARAVRVVIPRLLSNTPGTFGRRGLIRVLGDLVPQLGHHP